MTFTVTRAAFATFDATLGSISFQGSYTGTTIYAYIFAETGWLIVYGQLANENTLRLTITSFLNETATAASIVYTRDGALPVFTDYYNQVVGHWSGPCTETCTATACGAMSADIWVQTGAVFCGTTARNGAEERLVGTMTMLETSPAESGIAVDSAGSLWHVLSKNGQLVLLSTADNGTTTEAVLGLGVEMTPLPVQAQLYGNTFTGFALGGSKTEYTLSFTAQSGHMYAATLKAGSQTVTITGTLFVSNPILATVTADIDGKTVHGLLTADRYDPTAITFFVYDFSAEGAALVLYLENEVKS